MPRTYHREFGTAQLEGKYAAVLRRLTPRGSILEVGCHTGYFTRALEAAGHSVVGLESDAEAAAEACASGSNVLVGDIEDEAVLSNIPGKFDFILFMDVLEHLRDPEATLCRIRPLLNTDSRVLITGPNVGYFIVRLWLLLGRWEYQDTGILDRTHLHFYTRSTWRKMVEHSGYRVLDIESVEGMLPFQTRMARLLRRPDLVEWARQQALKRGSELFTIDYLIEAQPTWSE